MTEMKRRILLFSAVSLLQFVLVYFVLLQRFPNSGDEASFLFQARLFSRNQLYIQDALYDQANPLNKYVEADAIIDLGGKRFSKYDPGWAALLSLGVRLRAEWLVAPLLGALSVFLLLSHVSKRIGDEFVGPAWCLVTLCAFFSFSVANFGSHTATMAFLFGAFFLYDKAENVLAAFRTHRVLIRNPPDLWSADTLFFAYDDDDHLKELLAHFPQHSVYAYEYPGQLDPFP